MNNIKNKYRYPGAQPFTTQQKQIFFGRDKDVEKLYDLLRLEKLVVLYSKSGLGKSSLINAGIIPSVESDDLLKPFLIRFGAYIDEQKKTPISTTLQQINPSNNESSYLDKLLPKDNSFWYLIKRKQEKELESKGFLLVFDQFEELFTYSNKEIIRFTKELKEIISNQIPQRFREALEKQFEQDDLKLNEKELELLHEEVDIKILLAIRSDRMSLLNELKDYLPNILRHCYELVALSIEQAEDAILNPAYKKDENFICPNFDFEDESLDAILKFLTKNHTQRIESFQLQILCQNIEKKVIASKIDRIGISDIGDIESIYKNHYDNLIDSIGTKKEQLAARKLIEEGLIFEEEERRLSLYEGQISKIFGVGTDLLQRLVDSHLLRAEPSMQGGYTYELCHDTLVSSILASKNRRIEKEKINDSLLALEDAKRYLAESSLSTNTSSKFPILNIPIGINSISYEMVYIQGGDFVMGCSSNQNCLEDEKPAHLVKLNDFYIGKYEVTQKNWSEIMGNNPSNYSEYQNCPVENVSWEEIQIFISRLNQLTGQRFRLPTEAEWEYVARGGILSQGFIYSGSNKIGDVAWYRENSSEKPHKVGMKMPNELGIYDMSGNVYEWCMDFYTENYIGRSNSNPIGPPDGMFRVIRGGSFFDNSPNTCRVGYRAYLNPSGRFKNVGFRLVCNN